AVWIEHNFTGTVQNISITSNLNADGITYYYNHDTIAAGSYYWKQYANDTSGNMNQTIKFPYIIQKAGTTTSLYLNGSEANLSTVYDGGFNATGVTDNVNVILYRNGTAVNTSTSTIAFYYEQLAVGHYNITAINPGNQNYTGSEETWWLTITKAASSVNLLINGTDANYTINVSEYANLTGLLVIGDTADVDIYEDGTRISTGPAPLETIRQYSTLGLYNLTLVYNATENYTSNFETHWLNITDKTPPTPSNPTEIPADPATYSPGKDYQFNVTWTDNYAMQDVRIEHNFTGTLQNYSVTGNVSSVYYYDYTGLLARSYVWRMIANDTSGNYNVTDQYTYTVQQGATTTQLYLNGTQTNLSTVFDGGFNATGVTDALNVSIFKNGTLVNESSDLIAFYYEHLPVGHYNITAKNLGNGYSSSFETWWLRITRAQSAVNLLLNGTDGNITVEVFDTVNLTGILVRGENSIELYREGTLINNGTSPIENLTVFDTLGAFNITLSYQDSYNYSFSNETHYVIVQDTTRPAISLNAPIDDYNTSLDAVLFNFSVIDNYYTTLNCTLYINGSANATNATTSNGTAAWFNITGIGEGTHNWNVTCYDGSNNINSSEGRTFRVDQTGPVSTLINPAEDEQISTSFYTVNATITDIGVGSIDTAVFEYRINASSSFNFACADSDGSAPYECEWDLSTLPDSENYSFRVRANDTLGNFGAYDTHYHINVSRQNPQLFLIFPPNNYYTQSDAITFQYNVTDDQDIAFNCSLYVDGLLNQTNNSAQNNSISTFNISGVTQGAHTWYIKCNDSDKLVGTSATRTFTVDHTAPNWTNNVTNIASGSVYNPAANYQFNVTWDDNIGVESVLIEHNFTGTVQNYTVTGKNSNVYYYNYGAIPAGSYVWREYANDSAGNQNQTFNFTYVVTQASTTTSLYLNGSQANLSTAYDGGFNATAVTTAVDVTIYRNGTIVNASGKPISFHYTNLAVGHYNITAVNPGNNNYTGSQETWWLTITKAASSV
ncbi:hypothetical protein ACFL6I_27770, partial [candidate division KSB1 bacterium]